MAKIILFPIQAEEYPEDQFTEAAARELAGPEVEQNGWELVAFQALVASSGEGLIKCLLYRTQRMGKRGRGFVEIIIAPDGTPRKRWFYHPTAVRNCLSIYENLLIPRNQLFPDDGRTGTVG